MQNLTPSFLHAVRRITPFGLCVWLCLAPIARADDPAAKAAFIAAAFTNQNPEEKTLWLDKTMKADIKKILRHDYPALRVRYWQAGTKTLWVLDEIGKYKPITLGVVVQDGAIEALKVLAYRESHGWEVKHDFFTRQFIGARLPKNNALDRRIDGISGATLSVRALKKLARLALYCDAQVNTK